MDFPNLSAGQQQQSPPNFSGLPSNNNTHTGTPSNSYMQHSTPGSPQVPVYHQQGQLNSTTQGLVYLLNRQEPHTFAGGGAPFAGPMSSRNKVIQYARYLATPAPMPIRNAHAQSILLPQDSPLHMQEISTVRQLLVNIFNRRDPIVAQLNNAETVVSSDLDEITHKLWYELITVVHMSRYAHVCVARWPYQKLQVLAHMGIIPSWWWVREGTIFILGEQGKRINDSLVVQRWFWHQNQIKHFIDLSKNLDRVDEVRMKAP